MRPELVLPSFGTFLKTETQSLPSVVISWSGSLSETGFPGELKSAGVAPDGLCADLFAHWLELCASSAAADRIPVRSQIDMLTLPTQVLPWFFLQEWRDGRYRSVIAGTRLTDEFGFEPKGRFMDELLSNAVYHARRRMFDTCLELGVPFYYRGSLSKPADRYVAFQRLLLPLRQTENDAITMLFGVLRFYERAALSDREQRLMELDAGSLFHCSTYEDGHWTSWPPADSGTRDC